MNNTKLLNLGYVVIDAKSLEQIIKSHKVKEIHIETRTAEDNLLCRSIVINPIIKFDNDYLTVKKRDYFQTMIVDAPLLNCFFKSYENHYEFIFYYENVKFKAFCIVESK